MQTNRTQLVCEYGVRSNKRGSLCDTILARAQPCGWRLLARFSSIPRLSVSGPAACQGDYAALLSEHSPLLTATDQSHAIISSLQVSFSPQSGTFLASVTARGPWNWVGPVLFCHPAAQWSSLNQAASDTCIFLDPKRRGKREVLFKKRRHTLLLLRRGLAF